MKLAPGLVNRHDYGQLLQAPQFASLESFVLQFLQQHDSALTSYARQWISDPLHQWSRQWEYPFVFQEIAAHLDPGKTPGATILDAGSGVTFFPAYITQQYPDASVVCCDADPSYPAMFERIYPQGSRVAFRMDDLRSLSLDAASFDIVYCISVLEHTRDYPQILREFHRVLKPGGRLVLTFDVALANSADIPLHEAEILLQTLAQLFTPSTILPPIREQLDTATVTSTMIGSTNPELLPWKHPWLSHIKSAIKRGTLPRSRIKPLTFYCNSFIKGE
jgi:2-polyprenyl-3-methyl-5-hydroxy-6-metoxy-1,4-benzoquinol methylase